MRRILTTPPSPARARWIESRTASCWIISMTGKFGYWRRMWKGGQRRCRINFLLRLEAGVGPDVLSG
jgi:hypothetical protein